MVTKSDDAHKHALQLMGKLVPEGIPRDAVHITVAAVVNGHIENDLIAADPIKLVPGTDRVLYCAFAARDGVVDPYLTKKVLPGERFFIFLNPMSTTSLRHQWTHPSFSDEVTVSKGNKEESEQWLRYFCHANGDAPSYDELIRVIEADGERVSFGGDNSDDYYGGYLDRDSLHISGRDASGEIPSELWYHAEVVLGKPLKNKPTYFSCGC